MSKKRKTKHTKESNTLKYIAWFLGFFAFALFALVGGYYMGFEKAKIQIQEKEEKKQERRAELLKRIEQSHVPTADNVNERLKKVLQENVKVAATHETKIKPPVKEASKKELQQEVLKVREYAGAAHEYANGEAKTPPKRVKREVKPVSFSKPKLAIIIDDVSVPSHIEAIKSLDFDVTMAFLPPSKARPHSAKLAAEQDFYMVHLPMEAQSYSAEEPDTLRISDSQKQIAQRIQSIKDVFPRVKYVNNHTGSKYTADEHAMNRLMLALNANNISFVDSRTTSETKVPKVMENFSLKYIARDVFLDHHTDKAYVKGQIKQAVRIAKAEGVAIAIGHPHKNTISALKESTAILKDVDLVLINKVY